MEEVTINLIDLIHRILLRWRLILIWLIIGAVLGNCVGYLRALRRYQDEKEETALVENESETPSDEQTKVSADDYDLTDQQILSVQSAVDAYILMQRNYDIDIDYYKNSVKMQLDPNSVPTVTLQYYVDINQEGKDASSSVQDLTSDIRISLSEKILGEDVCQKIEEELSWEVDPAYIQELITTDIWNEEDTEQGSHISFNNLSDLLTIQVVAPEKNDCMAIGTCIKDAVNEGIDELQKVYGDFNLTLVQEQYMEKADADLLTYQQEKYSDLNGLRYSMDALTSYMTNDEEEYFEALISDQLLRDEALMNEEMTEQISSAPSPIRTRFLLLGAFLGVVIACGYLFLKYILAKNLRIKDDLEETYHMPLLGTIETEKKQPKFLGFIDRWINSWFAGKGNHYTNDERLEMICAGIRIAAEKAQMKNVYLTGTSNDDESQIWMQQMIDKLSGSIGISGGKSIVYDPLSLEDMTSSDGVVFIERVDYSPYEDLQKETELCKMYDTSIIGSVAIE